jgi:Flp pilus assembly pilin Flp
VRRGLTRRRRFARALGRTERGAVTVEAALITPLIALIIFGAVEFGFYFKEAHTVSSAATRGGRELSALPKTGNYQLRVAALVSDQLSVLNGDDLATVKVAIYKADTSAGHLGDGTLPVGISSVNNVWSCAQECWKFTWNTSKAGGAGLDYPVGFNSNDLLSPGVPNPAPWTPAEQWACAPDPNGATQPERDGRLDSAGVWISVTYKSITPLFAWLNGPVISHSVYVLEPDPDSSACAGSPDAYPPPNN